MILNKEAYDGSNGWITVNEYVDYKIINRIVFLHIKKISHVASWTTIATLPDIINTNGIAIYNSMTSGHDVYVYNTTVQSRSSSGTVSLSCMLSYPI